MKKRRYQERAWFYIHGKEIYQNILRQIEKILFCVRIMDPNFYQKIVDYLNYEKIPEDLKTAKQKKRFKTLTRQYHIQRGLLYKHKKDGTSTLVILEYQKDTIL